MKGVLLLMVIFITSQPLFSQTNHIPVIFNQQDLNQNVPFKNEEQSELYTITYLQDRGIKETFYTTPTQETIEQISIPFTRTYTIKTELYAQSDELFLYEDGIKINHNIDIALRCTITAKANLISNTDTTGETSVQNTIDILLPKQTDSGLASTTINAQQWCNRIYFKQQKEELDKQLLQKALTIKLANPEDQCEIKDDCEEWYANKLQQSKHWWSFIRKDIEKFDYQCARLSNNTAKKCILKQENNKSPNFNSPEWKKMAHDLQKKYEEYID